MLCNVKGIVLRSAEYGESDKLLTLLTHEKGKLVVCVKGGKSIKSKHMPSCELFAYSEFALYEKGGKYWVRESYLCESFFRVRRELEPMYLGQYLCEVACEFALYDMPDDTLLRLLLNSLFLLCSDSKDRRIIKAAFELKAASVEGFLPNIEGCAFCGKMTDTVYFEAIEGDIVCSECKNRLNRNEEVYERMAASPVLILDRSLIDAVSYIIKAPVEKVYSFSLPDRELDRLSAVCETFLLHQVEHGFRTLDFYKTLQRPLGGKA